MGDDLLELKEKREVSREEAAARLHAIADELASGNGVIFERVAKNIRAITVTDEAKFLRQLDDVKAIVASGFDANSVDPLSRMMLSSEDFRVMARTVKAAAAELCGGRLVLVHEGGYSEAYVPFCGLAVMEEISGHRTAVDDPLRLPIAGQQPTAPFNALQRKLIGEMAEALR